MGEYRCSSCGEVYRSDEYNTLDRQPLYPEEEDPERKGGYERVCGECGSGFHSEKWQLLETTDTPDGEIRVSTVALLIPHGLNHDQWFETVIGHRHGNLVSDRYETQEEAENGHEKRVEQIENGEYRFVPTGKQIELEADDV